MNATRTRSAGRQAAKAPRKRSTTTTTSTQTKARKTASTQSRSEDPGAQEPIGRRRWAIAEGYIPGWSNGPEPELQSHEACCILNAGDRDASIAITLFFEDRDPVGPYTFTVEARRTKHLRFNEMKDPEPIPRDTPYASVIEADVPVVVQHTRLDSRQAENALMTTIAYSEG